MEDDAPLLPDMVHTLHVEVRQSSRSSMTSGKVEEQLRTILEKEGGYSVPSEYLGWKPHSGLAPNIDRVRLAELSSSDMPSASVSAFSVSWLPAKQAHLRFHVYQCADDNEDAAYAGEGEDEVMTASEVVLPVGKWEGLWESLIYPDDIKSRLLDYIYTTVIYSDANVDPHIISWNRLVLLHGPPGGGKTSLAHALAQKLAIRLSKRFPTSRMLEVNSHSLFSKWFSESGKLVQQLFDHINTTLEDNDTFVTVLIDEVESLTAARASAMAGSEPSDAVRVVNALLTQLDKLKQRKNVLVMATSNLPDAIDTAFVDRADIIQYVDLPPTEAVYSILRSCLLEVMRAGLVHEAHVPEADMVSSESGSESSRRASRLWSIAQMCRAQQMSGRSLRRLPILAHTSCLKLASAPLSRVSEPALVTSMHALDVESWLDALGRIVAQQAIQKTHFGSSKSVL